MKKTSGAQKNKNGSCDMEGKKLSVRVIILVLCIALTFGTTGYVVAKYVGADDAAFVAASQGFRFESDSLADGNDVPEYNVYNGVVEFNLSNHSGVDITSEDIKYTIAITEAATGDPVNASLYTLTDDGDGLLDGGTADVNSIEVAFGGAALGQSYIITAGILKGEDGLNYDYSIRARFNLEDAGDLTFYKVDKFAEYCEVVIYAGSAATLNINYTGMIPDNTNTLMSGWTQASGQGTIQAAANTTTRLIFFGDGSATPQTIVTAGAPAVVPSVTLG